MRACSFFCPFRFRLLFSFYFVTDHTFFRHSPHHGSTGAFAPFCLLLHFFHNFHQCTAFFFPQNFHDIPFFACDHLSHPLFVLVYIVDPSYHNRFTMSTHFSKKILKQSSQAFSRCNKSNQHRQPLLYLEAVYHDAIARHPTKIPENRPNRMIKKRLRGRCH